MGLTLLAIALLVPGAEPGPAARLASGVLTARHTTGHISLDGQLDEAAWAEAPVFSSFVENFPEPGKTPDLRTEVRVLYDAKFLYLGITCFDPHPELILTGLGRRDSTPTADLVEVAIDSSADRRTAYDFMVNASGVLRDRLLFGDMDGTDTWDAVWDATARVGAGGWTVELAIPLRILRFSNAGEPWGIEVRRDVPRTHQVFESNPIPREANPVNTGGLVVSRFGRLEGLEELRTSRDIEVTPYAAARGQVRPQYSDPTTPTPRLFDPSMDIGLDFKMALTSKLSLTAAINPDFGQVEADQVIQNLSNAEAWFPEKRSFFLQGLDLFQSVGSEYGSPQQLFYSRRIGLEAPILGAAKLTGTIGDTLDVGVLDSVVLGPRNPFAGDEANPDRRLQWHPEAPLHFATNDSLPDGRPQPTNFLAAVARKRFLETSSVGAVFTAVTPLGPACSRDEFATQEDFDAAGCQGIGANVLGVDWNLRSKSGEWGVLGQVEASQQVGGPPTRVLADGTVMRPGDLGFGGHLRAGKLGGEPFRFDVVYVYEDAKLDLNSMGFQPLSNYQWADLNLHYIRPSGLWKFRTFSVDYNLDLNWTTDGKWLGRGLNNTVQAIAQLPSFDVVGLKVGLEVPQFDTREIHGAGVPFERLTDLYVAAIVGTDGNRALSVNGDLFGIRLFGAGQQPGAWGWGWDATVVWRPTDRLETRLDGSYGHKPQGARYVETLADNTAIFGVQDPAFLSVTLRQQLVLTPRLTLQVYAQLFSGAIHYGPYYSTSLDGVSRVAAGTLSPSGLPDTNPDAHTSALNLNAVLRWEYRLGSTLYFVYSHSQQERVPAGGQPVTTSWLPSRLFDGPANDTFLIKWSYWWAV